MGESSRKEDCGTSGGDVALLLRERVSGEDMLRCVRCCYKNKRSIVIHTARRTQYVIVYNRTKLIIIQQCFDSFLGTESTKKEIHQPQFTNKCDDAKTVGPQSAVMALRLVVGFGGWKHIASINVCVRHRSLSTEVRAAPSRRKNKVAWPRPLDKRSHTPIVK